MIARTLARYARAPRRRSESACELCAGPLADAHDHVADLDARRLACACRACALLFAQPGAARGRYRTVPDRVLVDPRLDLDDDAWNALGVPVRLAFVLRVSARSSWVAFYPSPAGATEAEVSPTGMDALAQRTPLVAAIEPDVEALLVRGRRGERRLAAYLVPISACYELAGVVRRHWKGLDGGDAHAEIDAFFARLDARARPLRVGGGM